MRKSQQRFLIIGLILLIGISSGCGTTQSLQSCGERRWPSPYAGTLEIGEQAVTWVTVWGHKSGGLEDLSRMLSLIFLPMSLVDTGCSFVADTVLLPLTLPYHLLYVEPPHHDSINSEIPFPTPVTAP